MLKQTHVCPHCSKEIDLEYDYSLSIVERPKIDTNKIKQLIETMINKYNSTPVIENKYIECALNENRVFVIQYYDGFGDKTGTIVKGGIKEEKVAFSASVPDIISLINRIKSYTSWTPISIKKHIDTIKSANQDELIVSVDSSQNYWISTDKNSKSNIFIQDILLAIAYLGNAKSQSSQLKFYEHEEFIVISEEDNTSIILIKKILEEKVTSVKQDIKKPKKKK